MSLPSLERVRPFFPLLAYLFGVLFLAMAGYRAFLEFENLIQEEKLKELEYSAAIKIHQVVAWRETQLRRGKALSHVTMLPYEFEQWLQKGHPADWRRQQFAKTITGLQQIYGYQAVALLDRQGTVKLAQPHGELWDTPDTALAKQAMTARTPLLSDIHRDSSGNQALCINVAVPLIANDPDRVVGAVLLRIDPAKQLFPLVQSWPTSSPSAETLLTRREGNEVVFLNELRHRKNTALTLRLPVATSNLPTAMWLRGEFDGLRGIDYRGVAVVSTVRQVPGTSWLMVAKIDKEELFAPIQKLKSGALSLGLLFLAGGGLLIFVWLQGIQERYRRVRSQRDAAVEHELLLKHFEYLTRYANDIILVADQSGKIVEANQRAEYAYGFSRDELLHMGVGELLPPGKATSLFDAQVAQLMQAGERIFETVNRRKDGSVFPVEISARVIAEKGVTFLQGIVRDISERKRAELELRRYTEQIEDLYNNAPCGYHSLDKDGLILQINDTELDWLGYSREDIVGKKQLLDLLSDKAKEIFHDTFPAFKQCGYVKNLKLELVRKDGTILPVVISATAIYDQRGDFLMSRSSVFDDTERRIAEEKLLLYGEIVANMDEGVALIQAKDGTVLYANPKFEKIFGYAPGEVSGLPVSALDADGDATREECMACDGKWAGEVLNRRKDGDTFWCHVYISAIEFHPFGTVWVAIHQDITERKRIEAMRSEIEHAGRLNLAVEMASGLAHELSQPLNAASNYLAGCLHRMKAQSWDQSKLHEAVELAFKQTERAAAIITHLKRFMRKQESERTVADISVLIHDTLNFLEHEIRRHTIELQVEITPLPLVNVNKLEIEQVLLNLLKNAIEAIRTLPTRELRVTARIWDAGHILVSIADSGRGIPQSGLNTLFTPFQTTKEEGLGLGLAICRSLVENHGGQIWVGAPAEDGAEFNFTLPCERFHD